jgi:hypothetical protein
MVDRGSYNEEDVDKITGLLIGRKIVKAEMGKFDIPGEVAGGWFGGAEGVLTLDDGTRLFLRGNDGGCSCGAGDYDLESVAQVDNVITSAAVNVDPSGDGEGGTGVYQIFVFADAQAINVATFRGDDGNGYYGTGFSLTVVPAEGDDN